MGRDEIYILKHKDLDVAMVKINPFSGRIEYVLEVYMPEELPVGCAEEGSGLAQWWNCLLYTSRAGGKRGRAVYQPSSYKTGRDGDRACGEPLQPGSPVSGRAPGYP